MQLLVNAVFGINPRLVLELLNVAITGACTKWAFVTEKQPSCGEFFPLFSSAKFTSRNWPPTSRVIGATEVCRGIEAVLSGRYETSASMKRKMLRVVAQNELGEVDPEMADCVIRAAWNGGTHQSAAIMALAQ